jgi:hypothetical protein
VVLHVLIGLAVFLAIASFASASFAKEHALGHTYMSIEGPAPAGFRVTLGGRALLELILGWWVGGRAVLGLFWLQRRSYPRRTAR